MFASFSQAPETYLVKAGEQPDKVIPSKDQYMYPEFLKGLLYFPQGKKSGVLLLDFNLLYSTVDFIDTNGDTLSIDEDANITEYVRIQSDLFFHDYKKGYFLMLTKREPVKLVVTKAWKIVRRDRVTNNGYGIGTGGSTSDWSSRRSPDNMHTNPNQNVVYHKETDYFLLAEKNKIYRATKSHLMKIFPDNKKKIQAYLEEHEVDFAKEEDLKPLIEFCDGLNSADRQ
jgi:hypothetical protein